MRTKDDPIPRDKRLSTVSDQITIELRGSLVYSNRINMPGQGGKLDLVVIWVLAGSCACQHVFHSEYHYKSTAITLV